MILKKLLLKNFRNYEDKEILFNGKFNFIFGNNGHGKTNILEGISCASFGKSFLGSTESDCIKFGADRFFVEADFENDIGNSSRVGINYDLNARSKSIYLNKEKVSSFSSEVFGRFPLVFLTPHSLIITYGNPSDRRKFFDITISQASRLYLDNLKELAKLLKQKNALLKNYSVYKKYSFEEFKNLFNSYNEKFAEISSQVIFKRLRFLDEFKKFFDANYSFLLYGDQSASVEYSSEAFQDTDINRIAESIDLIKMKLHEFIYSKSEEEILRGITLAGPQRDDYIFKIRKSGGGKFFELKNFASQGEHKTFLIALKLSEYEYLKEKKSTSPVLLLDDVLSELDEGRVSEIISHLKKYGQIFLTTTDENYLNKLKEFYDEDEISVFKIVNGNISG